LDIKMPGSILREFNEHVPARRRTGVRREVTISCTESIPEQLLHGREYFDISDEAAWVVSTYKRGHSVPALRDASLNTYWQTNGPLPHLLTLYFNRLTLISHLCIYVDTDVDGSYTPKTLSIRRGTQLCDMVENVLVHLANFKGWAVIPLCARGRNFVSAFILQIAILANHLNGRDSCIRQIKVFGPKFEWKSELSNKALVFSFEIDLWVFVIERPGGIPITLDVTGNIRDYRLTTTKLEDYQKKLSTMRIRLSSYMKELERAREELSSPTLVRNLLDLLIPYWDRACQLVEKYKDTLPIRNPADDIIEWHNFAIEVAKARSIAEDYLKKDKVDDDRRDMKQNSGALYHLNLPKWELLKFDGDVLQFETFWEQFEDQIHRQSELRDTTKFTYLRSCLTGNALNAIDGLSVTAANYSAAIEILKSRALEVLGKNPSSPELTESEVLLEIFKLKVEESVSMDDHKPSSNVTFIRRKSPPRNRLPSVAALHAEPRSFEGCTVCGEHHRRQGKTYVSVASKGGTKEIGARKPNDVITRPVGRGITNCYTSSTEKDEDVSSNRALLGRTSTEKENLLQTARVILQSDDGNQLFVTYLFDSGCQRSLIRKDLAESLRLKCTTERLMLLRMGESHSKYEKLRCVNFRLKGIYGGEDSYPIEALCVPRITTVDANPSAANWHHLHGLNLADIFPRERTENDVLIRIDFYNRLLFRERIVGGITLPEAVNTPFGWIVSEIIGVTDDKGAEDNSVSRLMKTFEETLEYSDGRYTVKLPWKPGFPNLSNNYTHALQRLFKTEASLLNDTTKSEMYSKTLKEYMTEGIIERTLTKGRIVFGASAHFGRTSLNRQLDTGPSLQRDLTSYWSARGRIPNVSSDRITQQIERQDRDVTRFLWKEPGDPSHPQTFRFRRLCFRLTCSPFLASAAMQHHAKQNKDKWPKAAEEVLKNVYVDDLLFSLDDRTETVECVKELKQLTETAGFCLTKWSSTEPTVLRSLPEKGVASDCKPKTSLGIVWDNKEDTITSSAICVARSDQQMTNRGMLSAVMMIFDPLGYLSPFLVKAKRMLQNMLKDWQDWITEIPSISEIRLPRCLLPIRTDCIKEVELHGYGDASEMAFWSTVYLRITTVLGEIITNFVMSKTRIAPVKRVTLPRLELMAALITARLLSFVKTSLEVKFSRIVCWTDSQIALRWIQGDSYRWKPFVGNRVESILELTEAQWWRYCPTTDNPADVLTSGCSLKDLVSINLWWHGPHWLAKCEDVWPTAKLELTIDRSPEFQAEVQKLARELHVQAKTEAVLDVQKYCRLTKLLNVTAYVLRFITKYKVTPEERKSSTCEKSIKRNNSG
ncbi:Anaphase-promoting complex subunit 10, partial [Trichinella patagoniensis]